MIRISRLSDYAVVIAAWLAEQTEVRTLEDISGGTHIPLATVRKVTRLLTLGGLCAARKGAHGGYQLSEPAEQITLLAVLEAVDGELAMTQCAKSSGCECSLVGHCAVEGGWRIINRVIRATLSHLTVADLRHVDLAEETVWQRLLQDAAGESGPVILRH
jgi:FeS assembly SUF system regulator